MSLWSAAPMTTEEAVIENEEDVFDEKHPRDAWIPHVAPYVGWIFLMGLLGDPEGWKYAARTVLCLGLLMYCRPWRWYPKLNLKNVPAAIGLGIFVFLFWIAGETPLAAQFPFLQKLYLTGATIPPWELMEVDIEYHYHPETCGWLFTLMRIAGSAFVISIIEEFFWRGYVYRSVLGANFLKVDLGRLCWKPFLIVCLFFGFMHIRWAAGLLCAILYGLFVIRTKDVWAAGIAHVVTNLLLGIYVVMFDEYQFWS